MIEITNKSREFTEVEQYLMTSSPEIVSMKDVADGTEICVNGIIEFTDDNNGMKDKVNVMSLITSDLKAYAFQSATFKKSVLEISNIYHGEPFTIIKTSGLNKNGREYINCYLKVDIDRERQKARELLNK